MTPHSLRALPEEWLRFETLLIELSARFAGVRSEAIDDEIEYAQASVCTHLGIDQCTLWQSIAGSREACRLTHHYNNSSEGVALIEQMYGDASFPRFRKQLAAGAVVSIPSMEAPPPAVAADAALSRRCGIKSTLAFPLAVGDGRVTGFLYFNSLRAEHIWPEGLLERLQLVAKLFADVLARAQSERISRDAREAPFVEASADAGLWCFNLESGVFSANERAREIHGLAAGAPVALKDLPLFIRTEDLTRLRPTIAAASRSHREETIEYRVLRGDRRTRWIASRIRVHRAADGEAGLVTGMSLDVTERKRDEAAVAEEMRLEALIGTLSTRFVVVSADRVDDEIRAAQERLCDCVGLDQVTILRNEVFVDESSEYLVVEVYRDGFTRPARDVGKFESFPWAWKQLIAGKTIVFSSLDALPPEAATDRVSWRDYGTKSGLILPMSAATGEAIGIIGFATRLAERDWPEGLVQLLRRVALIFGNALSRKRAELVLRESEARLKLAMDSAGAGLWSIDLETRRMWVTPRMSELLAFFSADTAKLTMADFVAVAHPDDRDAIRQAILDAIESEAPLQIQYRVVLPDGGVRWLSARGQRHCDGAGRADRLTGISIDITDQKLVEAEKREHFAELAHLNRLSTAGELTTSLAHELSQPLGAILRNTEAAEIILASDNPDLEDLRAIVSDIQKADKRAGDVIDRLRALLKRRNAELQPLDLGPLVGEVVSLVRNDAMGRHIKIDTDLPVDLPLVLADRVHLQQVLINLMLNGMDAIDHAPSVEQRLVISARMSGERTVEVAVSDTGCGMLPETMNRKFEPFYTTKVGGMGMGLVISRTIVEAHGGRIWAENNETRGATFRFTLRSALQGDTH
jgi:PAS domain S-box-containing protein